MLPTMGWEGMWKGIALWMGVEEEQLADVLPNLENFEEEDVIQLSDMFELEG